MKYHLWTLLLATAAILVGCNSDSGPKPNAITTLPAQSFARAWRAQLPLGKDHAKQIFLREDLVFVYTDQHAVYVLKRDNLTINSVQQVGNAAEQLWPPVIVGDKIYYPKDAALEVYNRTGAGKYVGEMTLSFTVSSSAVADGHYLFFGAEGAARGLLCVDATDYVAGASKHTVQHWILATDTGKSMESGPAVFQGVVYGGFDDGKVYAVNVDTRAGIWATPDFNSPTRLTGYFRADDAVQADLRVDGSSLYVASTDTKLYCLDRTKGKVQWTYYAHTALRQAPEITAALVYQYVPGTGLVALDKTSPSNSPKPKWTVADATQLLAEDDAYSYLLCPGASGNVITAVDKKTGQKKFTAKRKDLSIFATNTKDGVIYGATDRGEVLAIVPVFKGGTMGEEVMEFHEKPVAVAAAR